MKLALKKLMIIIALATFSGQVLALRCGHRLVNKGDGKVKVYSRCGDPDFSEMRERYVPRNCNSGYQDDYGYFYNGIRYMNDRNNYHNCHVEIVEVWTYNFGPRKFMRELIFIGGILKEINSLEYGY